MGRVTLDVITASYVTQTVNGSRCFCFVDVNRGMKGVSQNNPPKTLPQNLRISQKKHLRGYFLRRLKNVFDVSSVFLKNRADVFIS